MLELTNFQNLYRVVRSLGAEQRDSVLPEEILKGTADLDPSDLVKGSTGLFYVDATGVVSRVVVHIADKDMSYMNSRLRRKVSGSGLNNQTDIEHIHRYHILFCGTLRAAEEGGWRDKYKMSRNDNGTFVYRFIKNNRVVANLDNQELYICKNCMRELKKLPKVPSEMRTNWPIFELKTYLNLEIQIPKMPGDYQQESVSLPNAYARDWDKISKNYKEKIGWRCEDIRCKNPDLSEARFRKYLHLHHKNMQKSDNSYTNLAAYCIACHADQPNHSHLKPTPAYKEYMRMRGL